MLVGFGCTVPAIMSTRTLPSEHDRKMTVMLTPFMSCSAKLPVYGLLCGAFFPQATVPAMVSLYLIGIAVGCIAALVLNHTAFKGDPVPFIMELPNYRLPSVKTTVMLAWDKAKDFITKAFTIIFAATVVIWFLQTFDIRFNVVADQSQSLLAGLGGIIAPVLAPLGFGDWRASTALVTGLIAKESVISTLTVLWVQPRPRHCQPCFRRLPLTCSWSLRCCTRLAWRPSVPSRVSWAGVTPWPYSRFR